MPVRDPRTGRFCRRTKWQPVGSIAPIPCHIELECTEDLRAIVVDLRGMRSGHCRLNNETYPAESARCRAWASSRIVAIETELIRRREWRQTA